MRRACPCTIRGGGAGPFFFAGAAGAFAGDASVDAAVAGEDRVVDHLHGLHVRHVEDLAVDGVALFLQLRGCGGKQVRVHVREHDGGAGLGKRLDGRKADAARGTRDDGDLAGELELVEIHVRRSSMRKGFR